MRSGRSSIVTEPFGASMVTGKPSSGASVVVVGGTVVVVVVVACDVVVRVSGGVVSETRAEYRRVLKAIKQLDEDHEVGKLADADHQSLREDLTLKAVELKRQIKTAEGSSELHPELAARLQGAAVAPASAEASPSLIVCPSCELENDPDARFCKGCGATLGEAASTQEVSA